MHTGILVDSLIIFSRLTSYKQSLCNECCQAQPQLNSSQLQLKLRLGLALFSLDPLTDPAPPPTTNPATHPIGTAVSEPTSRVFQDYFKTR